MSTHHHPLAKLGFAVLVLGAALCVGCGGSVSGSLRDAEDAGSAPAGMSVVYDDHSAGFGGERIELDAEGVLTLRRYRPALGGEPEVAATVRGQVAPEQRMELITLLVEIEAWSQHDMPETSINDARASLELRVGSDRSRIWEWADDLDANERLSRVERLLMRFAADLEAETAGGEGAPTSGGEAPVEGEEPNDERAVPGVAPVQITDQTRPRR
ncbi:MAG: hypothetical protein IPG81_33330 [Sandaracinaceae bacterium]|nr:hypothetical protein [Sandaracinaceae bacterium]